MAPVFLRLDPQSTLYSLELVLSSKSPVAPKTSACKCSTVEAFAQKATNNEEDLRLQWMYVSKAKNAIFQGPRYENFAWRLWFAKSLKTVYAGEHSTCAAGSCGGDSALKPDARDDKYENERIRANWTGFAGGAGQELDASTSGSENTHVVANGASACETQHNVESSVEEMKPEVTQKSESKNDESVGGMEDDVVVKSEPLDATTVVTAPQLDAASLQTFTEGTSNRTESKGVFESIGNPNRNTYHDMALPDIHSKEQARQEPGVFVSAAPTHAVLATSNHATQFFNQNQMVSSYAVVKQSDMISGDKSQNPLMFSRGAGVHAYVDANDSTTADILSPAAESDIITRDPRTTLVCGNCGTSNTPLWRRGIDNHVLCNACGLYEKLHHIARPKVLKPPPKREVESTTECSNCGTRNTPLWRKDDQNNTLCNACGLYYKLHNTKRPLSMKTDVIRKRQRSDHNQTGENGANRKSRRGGKKDEKNGKLDQLAYLSDRRERPGMPGQSTSMIFNPAQSQTVHVGPNMMAPSTASFTGVQGPSQQQSFGYSSTSSLLRQTATQYGPPSQQQQGLAGFGNLNNPINNPNVLPQALNNYQVPLANGLASATSVLPPANNSAPTSNMSAQLPVDSRTLSHNIGDQSSFSSSMFSNFYGQANDLVFSQMNNNASTNLGSFSSTANVNTLDDTATIRNDTIFTSSQATNLHSRQTNIAQTNMGGLVGNPGGSFGNGVSTSNRSLGTNPSASPNTILPTGLESVGMTMMDTTMARRTVPNMNLDNGLNNIGLNTSLDINPEFWLGWGEEDADIGAFF